MLVLSRKSNESFVIGGPSGFEQMLKLTVIDVAGGTVKLGIEVAQDVPVHSWEAWERICAGALPNDMAYANEASAAV
jgi:carbon storage regulator CsrA